jgi:SanA protein
MKKKIIYLLIIVGVLLISSLYFCNKIIVNASNGKLYSDVESIPYTKTGLLLGTSRELPDGRRNPFYYYRILAAVELFKAHKIKYVIVSGDNSRVNYNEPEMMRDDLVKQGVDSSKIFLDYAGFRTFDSIVRLKEIFSQDSATIISQQFHNERAIYIAGRENIYVVGFNAKDISVRAGLRTQIRERFARVKVFIDYLFGKKPKFLGNKVSIS